MAPAPPSLDWFIADVHVQLYSFIQRRHRAKPSHVPSRWDTWAHRLCFASSSMSLMMDEGRTIV
eukprot:4761981-Prymnesium_polylepis.1